MNTNCTWVKKIRKVRVKGEKQKKEEGKNKDKELTRQNK
jgi:hypothetical protein